MNNANAIISNYVPIFPSIVGAKNVRTAPSPASTAAATTTKTRLHLVTDAGFVVRFLVCLAVLAVATYVGLTWYPYEIWYAWESHGLDPLRSVAHRYALWSVLGLLSSACCALQVLLNALSWGCAGFNARLGPRRPLLLALTVWAQAVSWGTWWWWHPRRTPWTSVVGGSVVAVSLSLLPEGLLLWEKLRTVVRSSSSSSVLQNNNTTSPRSTVTHRLTIRLEIKMGCSACASAVSNVLQGIPRRTGHAVSAEEGVATLQLDLQEQEERDETTISAMAKHVAEQLEGAGLPTKVLHTSVHTIKHPSSAKTNGYGCHEDVGRKAWELSSEEKVKYV